MKTKILLLSLLTSILSFHSAPLLAKGDVDGGGGNRIGDQILDSYLAKRKVSHEKVLAILEKHLKNLDQRVPNFANLLRERIKVRNWFVVDKNVKFKRLGNERKLLSFDSQQVAIQDNRDVFINSDEFSKLNAEEQVNLYMHELIMSLKVDQKMLNNGGTKIITERDVEDLTGALIQNPPASEDEIVKIIDKLHFGCLRLECSYNNYPLIKKHSQIKAEALTKEAAEKESIKRRQHYEKFMASSEPVYSILQEMKENRRNFCAKLDNKQYLVPLDLMAQYLKQTSSAISKFDAISRIKNFDKTINDIYKDKNKGALDYITSENPNTHLKLMAFASSYYLREVYAEYFVDNMDVWAGSKDTKKYWMYEEIIGAPKFNNVKINPKYDQNPNYRILTDIAYGSFKNRPDLSSPQNDSFPKIASFYTALEEETAQEKNLTLHLKRDFCEKNLIQHHGKSSRLAIIIDRKQSPPARSLDYVDILIKKFEPFFPGESTATATENKFFLGEENTNDSSSQNPQSNRAN